MPVVFPNNNNSFNKFYSGSGFKRGIVKEVKVVNGLIVVDVELTEEKLLLPNVQVVFGIAHKKTGIVAVPSVGDEVLVGFVDNDIARPVVLGSMYNPQNTPPINVNNDNTDINITLPSGKASGGKKGTKIDISCESNKSKITITTEKGHKIELDDDKETIDIKEKSGKTDFKIDFKNGKITLKAEKTIAMQAGNNKFNLDSNKGASIECSSGDINTKANNFKCNANANAEINAKAKGVFKSNGQLELNGAMAKVNASGILELKGSMTKIN